MVRAHPELERRITPRYSELRVDGGFLKVIASDAPLAHGLTPSLVLVDELHAHRDGELYEAMRTSMLKRAGLADGHDQHGRERRGRRPGAFAGPSPSPTLREP